VSFSTGGPHTYVATVNALTSNEVTVSREAWTVSLATTEATFAAGDSVTLTATANQDVGNTGGSYTIQIFDTTTGGMIRECTSGTTCSYAFSGSPFTTGGARPYVAVVAQHNSYAYNYSTVPDIQATSNSVTEAREAWTVSLTSSETTYASGDSVTLTATANQDVGNTGGALAIVFYSVTGGYSLGWCLTGTTCTHTFTTLPFTYGAPQQYAAVIASPTGEGYSSVSNLQATSNIVTETPEAWTVSLATTETTFAAGDLVTLTATANQDVGVGGIYYTIQIFDVTTGQLVQECTSGATCTYGGTYPIFTSGGPHQYVAVVAHYSEDYAYSAVTDLQATSNVITETREAWTVSLTSSVTTFAAGQPFTFMATANQDVGKTEGAYAIDIYDTTFGILIHQCTSGTTCGGGPYSTFYSGPPHTFVAVIERSDNPDLHYSAVEDVQSTSNVVTIAREAWTVSLATVSLTQETASPNWYIIVLKATANQDVGLAGGAYEIRIVNYTTGDLIGACWMGTTCTWTDYFNSADPPTYAAYIANPYGSGETDVQAISNGFSANTGSGAILAGESSHGSNPAENAQCGCGGDPVNTETGEFYQTVTDLGIPGAGPALQVQRSYSSAGASSDGPFGYGWTANFDAHLATLVGGDSDDPLPRQVQITQPNGSTVQFSENPDQSLAWERRVGQDGAHRRRHHNSLGSQHDHRCRKRL
jgi:hypothetical protein